MLTGITVLALLVLDGVALAGMVTVGNLGVFWTVVSMPVLHNLFSAFLMRILAQAFPVSEGSYQPGSRDYNNWQARAFLACLSCNYFDQFVPVLLKAQWYRLFGGRIARNARIAGRILDCTLVEIGSGALVGFDSLIMAHYELNGTLCIGRVRLEEGAVVGSRAVVLPGVTVEDGAIVGACALVVANRRVPAGEIWGGVPARKKELNPVRDPALESIGGKGNGQHVLAQTSNLV
ncbi:MAG: hypothetical protein C0404_12000 [Verrucomicrobia bacterium]|nr:hypothetical protein [Verrucomicrobiota bacterium]